MTIALTRFHFIPLTQGDIFNFNPGLPMLDGDSITDTINSLTDWHKQTVVYNLNKFLMYITDHSYHHIPEGLEQLFGLLIEAAHTQCNPRILVEERDNLTRKKPVKVKWDIDFLSWYKVWNICRFHNYALNAEILMEQGIYVGPDKEIRNLTMEQKVILRSAIYKYKNLSTRQYDTTFRKTHF